MIFERQHTTYLTKQQMTTILEFIRCFYTSASVFLFWSNESQDAESTTTHTESSDWFFKLVQTLPIKMNSASICCVCMCFFIRLNIRIPSTIYKVGAPQLLSCNSRARYIYLHNPEQMQKILPSGVQDASLFYDFERCII